MGCFLDHTKFSFMSVLLTRLICAQEPAWISAPVVTFSCGGMMSIQTCSKGFAEESYKVIEKTLGVVEMVGNMAFTFLLAGFFGSGVTYCNPAIFVVGRTV